MRRKLTVKKVSSHKYFLTGNYMLKDTNRSTSTMCEICSKSTIKTSERRCSGVLLLTLHVFHTLF